jgi:ABC-type sugar transport system ATPase subunit
MPDGLVAHDLAKAYGSVTVVQGVGLRLSPHEIRAVVGENGAGKSTLMKMLAGIVPPTRGEIELDGRPVAFSSPSDATAAGIAIVHQELQQARDLSLADNVMLLRPPGARALRRGSRAESEFVADALSRVGLARAPSDRAGGLSVAEGQLLEVAKALALGARYIIFDEPTSALPPADVERLLSLVEGLRSSGHGILYISHHLSEVLRVADTLTVLRDGRLVGDLRRSEIDMDGLIRLMVDRPVSLYANDLHPAREAVVFEARGAATAEVSGLDLQVRQGEILGFAGLIGSGMHEAALAVAGAAPLTTGSFRIGGAEARFRSPYDASRAGIALVPEERKAQAILPDLSVTDNLHVGRYWLFSRMGLLSRRRLRRRTGELVRDFNIRLARVSQPIATLSGGNQQKAVVARCVQSEPRLLVVAEPTRGVDIGAKDEIHRRIIGLAAKGTAIIVVSSELDEVLALSHRVAVFSAGRLVGVLEKASATPERVMRLATPGSREGGLRVAV